MTRRRWLLSVFLLWHVVAICAAAIPSPSVGRETGDSQDSLANDGNLPASTLTRIHEAVWSSLAPVRWITRPYVNAIGLDQRWSMFSNPADGSEYVRVRHYVSRRGRPQPAYIATELISPVHREDRVRLFAGFVGSFRDKAVASSLERFLSERRRMIRAMQAESPDLHDTLTRIAQDPPLSLAPVARFFAARYAAKSLKPGDTIVRSEIWFGVAPRPRGDGEMRRLFLQRRADVVRDYYAGAIVEPFFTSAIPPDGATQREGDILWSLLYREER
jgi:hypothetical protein